MRPKEVLTVVVVEVLPKKNDPPAVMYMGREADSLNRRVSRVERPRELEVVNSVFLMRSTVSCP